MTYNIPIESESLLNSSICPRDGTLNKLNS